MAEQDLEFDIVAVEAPVPKTQCNPDRTGKRHADRCTVVHTQVGAVWELEKGRVRKVHANKLGAQPGVETIELFRNGESTPFLVRDFNQGFDGGFYSGNETIRTRVTTKELGPDGYSQFYIHVEWYR